MISPLEDEISKIHREFYLSQPKKMFMTKTQKEECSEYVVQKISLDQLMKNTVYVIKNTNYGFKDEPLFKQYITSIYYEKFTQYVVKTICDVIMIHGTYEMHINLLSFSVSAVEKYHVIIHTFYEMCCQSPENVIVTRLSSINIYNTPIMIHVIKAMLSKLNVEAIRGKTIFYTKEESPGLLLKLVIGK